MKVSKNGGVFIYFAGALVGVGPYKPKKVRPSNLSANFVVSPVDSSEEEVRDKRIVCPLLRATLFYQDRLGSFGTNMGKALIKNDVFLRRRRSCGCKRRRRRRRC